MKVVLLPEAEGDIDRLYDFLVNSNPLAAQKAVLAIDEGITLLSKTPYLGVELQVRPDYRELSIKFGKSAYVLRYRILPEEDLAVIVRIWHSREDRS